MSTGSDWIYLKTALPDLRDYILSAEIYWTLRPAERMPGGASLPQLTIGNLLLSQARLCAQHLPDEQSRQLAEFTAGINALHEEWRANWERKMEQELRSRTNLWQQYLRDLRAEARRSDAIYASQVRQRAISHLLQRELPAGLPPELADQFALLDTLLRALARPGPFVWEAELSGGFPQDDFWFLYLSVSA